MGNAITVTGMVLSASVVGEYDKRLVLLTKERGKISAFAKGARRQNSPLLAGTRPFSYGTFMLYEGRNSYTISSIEIVNYFMKLSDDFIGAYYGFYFLEFADYYARENVDETQMLKLLYQSFRAIEKGTIPRELIRSVFELKAMAVNGECPQVFSCVQCKDIHNCNYFSIEKRGIICGNCTKGIKGGRHLLDATVYTMQFVISSEIEKLYTFTTSREVLQEFALIMKQYTNCYIERKMKSLEILNHINAQNLH